MKRDYSAIRRVLVITMLLNLAATIIKLSVGIWTGALSLIADGLDTLSDSSANVIGLLATRIAQRPPDDDHPYGHRKYETVAAILMAALLFVVAWELFAGAINRLLTPVAPEINAWSIGALVIGGALQGVTGWWEIRQGRRLRSEVLVVDGRHAVTSLFISAGVLVGLLLVRLGFVWADAVVALVIAVWIARIGVQTVRENIPALVDEAQINVQAIEEIVGDVSGVESFHRIRSRGTPDNVAVDLHVRVAPHLSMQSGNAIGDEVRRRLLDLSNVADVTVHVEAERGPESATDIYGAVKLIADEAQVLIHEFWVQQLDGRQFLHLHVGVSPSLLLAEAHETVDGLEQTIRERLPQIEDVHTHIELANVDVLPSARVSRHLQQQVESAVFEAAQSIPQVASPHAVSVFQVEGKLFITISARVDGQMYVDMAHELSEDLARAVRATLPNVGEVLIHLEPDISA